MTGFRLFISLLVLSQVIDNFKEKVQQMKELRRANLEKLVEKLREQIREYWDKCYYR